MSDNPAGLAGGYTYEGTELDVFARARRWKHYLRKQISPDIGGSVLEVGAGLGATMLALHTPDVSRWECLEPDARLAERLAARQAAGDLPPCRIVTGTIDQASRSDYDVILYVDVLEHIEDDEAELAKAAKRLRKGGRLVVLSPALPWLYSEFDRAIGHHRRYTKTTLGGLTPGGMTLLRLDYLDVAGLLTSAANRMVLRSATPSESQVLFWDRVIVPVSAALDRRIKFSAGKSILAVWKKD